MQSGTDPFFRARLPRPMSYAPDVLKSREVVSGITSRRDEGVSVNIRPEVARWINKKLLPAVNERLRHATGYEVQQRGDWAGQAVGRTLGFKPDGTSIRGWPNPRRLVSETDERIRNHSAVEVETYDHNLDYVLSRIYVPLGNLVETTYLDYENRALSQEVIRIAPTVDSLAVMEEMGWKITWDS